MEGLTSTQLLEEDIFALLGLEGASDDKKKELFETMTRTVDARVINRISHELSEEESSELANILVSGDTQKVTDYLKQKDINLPKIIMEEAIRYRTEVAELINLASGGK